MMTARRRFYAVLALACAGCQEEIERGGVAELRPD
jgi:hypothetical protein